MTPQEWTWRAKKANLYCPKCGKRAKGYINGIGYCETHALAVFGGQGKSLDEELQRVRSLSEQGEQNEY